MEETKKEGYWENKDSKGPLHILKKKKIRVPCAFPGWNAYSGKI